MKLKQITLHHIRMNLKTPFSASNATYTDRDFIIVEAEDQNGIIGWGEGVAFSSPWYTEETVKTTWHMLEDFLIPITFHLKINDPKEISKQFKLIRRNFMAKAAIEEAIWDLYAKQENKALSAIMGGSKTRVEAGVAVGIQSIRDMLLSIEAFLDEGYRRIKVKIKPGADIELIKAIREEFPGVLLMADANSSYTLKDIDRLKAIDEFQLLMIEQPLGVDDIMDHAKLQRQLKTPICLDESITTLEDTRKALELDSCRVVNIKMGRVGGIHEAKQIHDLCYEKNIPVWCGGMLETGIGRAHNLALSSLDNFILPADLSASSRYWYEDIVEPEFFVEDGFIDVPVGVGIGVTVNRKRLEKFTVRKQTFKNEG